MTPFEMLQNAEEYMYGLRPKANYCNHGEYTVLRDYIGTIVIGTRCKMSHVPELIERMRHAAFYEHWLDAENNDEAHYCSAVAKIFSGWRTLSVRLDPSDGVIDIYSYNENEFERAHMFHPAMGDELEEDGSLRQSHIRGYQYFSAEKHLST